jgi:hypothetical protein
LTTEIDDRFYERADAHIHIANEHVEDIGRGKVSASFMYAVARFNAWVTACGLNSADELRAAQDETVEYFVAQYRAMLIENLNDYSTNFDKYMRPARSDA